MEYKQSDIINDRGAEEAAAAGGGDGGGESLDVPLGLMVLGTCTCHVPMIG